MIKQDMGGVKVLDYIADNQYTELLSLIHNAFHKYKEQGLHITCSYYTIDDIRSFVLSDKVLIAVLENNQIIGVTFFYQCKDNIWYERCIAISPEMQRMGIGRMLHMQRNNILQTLGCSYLLSDTSIYEVQSIKWHINTLDFYKIGYESYKSTNYYSYVFRKDILYKSSWIEKHIKYPILFCFRYFKCRLMKRVDGTYTLFGSWYYSFRK